MKVCTIILWSLIALVFLSLFPFCLNMTLKSQADFGGSLGFMASWMRVPRTEINFYAQ